jgi:hypothetical protein
MPGWATSLREFSTSNGCQNHTTSPYAAPHLSQRLRRAKRRSSACHSSAHGPYDPPCHPLTSPDAAASTASRPASVTIASRPSVEQDQIAILLILPRRQAKLLKIRNRSEGRRFRIWLIGCLRGSQSPSGELVKSIDFYVSAMSQIKDWGQERTFFGFGFSITAFAGYPLNLNAPSSAGASATPVSMQAGIR